MYLATIMLHSNGSRAAGTFLAQVLLLVYGLVACTRRLAGLLPALLPQALRGLLLQRLH